MWKNLKPLCRQNLPAPTESNLALSAFSVFDKKTVYSFFEEFQVLIVRLVTLGKSSWKMQLNGNTRKTRLKISASQICNKTCGRMHERILQVLLKYTCTYEWRP